MKSFRVLLVLLSVTFLVISCGQSADKSFESASSGTVIESMPALDKNIHLQHAIIWNSIDECKKEQNEKIRIDCERNFRYIRASQEGDGVACEALDTIDIQSCKNGVLMRRAEKENNIELCKQFSSSEFTDLCHDRVKYFTAEKNQDSSSCLQIKNPELQMNCLSLLKKDTDCTKFSSPQDKASCEFTHSQFEAVMSLVKDKKKVDCSTILDMNLRQLCGQEMGLLSAVEKKDKTFCETLSTSFTYGDVKEKDYRGECLKVLQ